MRFLCYTLPFLLVAANAASRSSSKLGNDLVCHKWNCLNTRLNGTVSPDVIASLADWENIVGAATLKCTEVKSKGYTSTCPGQAFLHCFVTELSKNCPVNKLQYFKNNDFCSAPLPRASASSTFLFSQSRYYNYEKHAEQRPQWFLRRHFSNNCCDFSDLFNRSVLEECGFEELVHYQDYYPRNKSVHYDTDHKETTQNPKKLVHSENKALKDDDIDDVDPLDCCFIDDFVQPKWREECDLQLKWDNVNRLTVVNESDPITTTTAPSLKNKDVKIVPLACEKQKCFFNKLNITNDGVVNKDAFSRLLDTMTDRHKEWIKAKAKVVTQCLNKPLIGYDGGCEINNILSCTYDILTENCPNANKYDPCKHSSSVLDGLICQISSSMYRPRHRRQFCSVPDFVDKEIHEECGVSMTYKLEYIHEPQVKTSKWGPANCKDLSQQTTCLLNKMNVMNKYGFIDHFKMKDRIGLYAESFSPVLQNTYKNAFDNGLLYRQHCGSTKKLLNIIDSMILTCPPSQLNIEEKCQKLMSKIKLSEGIEIAERQINRQLYFNAPNPVIKPKANVLSIYRSNSRYNFGILGSEDEPSVNFINLNTEKTLVLRPVYESYIKPQGLNTLHNDGILRSNKFD